MFSKDVKALQEAGGLDVDGVVGMRTWDVLCQAIMPTSPAFSPLSEARKKELFGDPTGGRLDPFEEDGTFTPAKEFRSDLVPVDVPGWFSVKGTVTMHHLAADPLRRLIKAWDKSGGDKFVRSFGGSLAFRKVRGGISLSSHAFGTAFDINVQYNPLGQRPAMPWEPGCVFELVKIANGEGWFWGGHFSRLDGMHFELGGV